MKNPLRQIWPVIHETFTRFSRNEGQAQAAAMSYYAALSFFPLLLVLISGLGFALRLSPGFAASAQEFGQNAQQRIISSLVERNTSPAQAKGVEQLLGEVKVNASVGGPLGILTLLFGAIGIFSQLDTAFSRIWHDQTPQVHGWWSVVIDVLTNRLKAFLVLMGLGLLIVLLFFAGTVFTVVREWASQHHLPISTWDDLQTPITIAINALVFAMLYKVLPRPKVRWPHALGGGAFVALVWELGRQALAYVIGRANYSTYGVIGAFLAMMVWVYYASTLLFLGAQMVQVLGHPRDDDGAAA